MAGRWSESGTWAGQSQFNPVKNGFTRFYGLLGGKADYLNHVNEGGIIDWWQGPCPTDDD